MAELKRAYVMTVLFCTMNHTIFIASLLIWLQLHNRTLQLMHAVQFFPYPANVLA